MAPPKNVFIRTIGDTCMRGASGFLSVSLMMVVLVLSVMGCTTTGRGGTAQFEPLPKARLGEAPLEPVAPRTVTDLLRDAQEAFQAANTAQEAGDSAAALRHYSLMLELLAEADLDPAIFYSVRDQFATILNLSAQQADVMARRVPRDYGESDFQPIEGYSEIQVPFPLPERVLDEIERIENEYPKNFQAGLDRSFRYLPFIRAELTKAGLPQELEMLVMVESQFHPTVRSRAGAVGMWQFIKATGRRYGLRIDGEVDERRNWQRETRAAIAYLKDLHDIFEGDWALAISAYNMGEGGLSRAIAANGGDRDLWRLFETPPAANRIRLETKRYYPKFLATLIVTSNPERYGFKVNPQPPEDTVRIEVTGPYLLADLDEAMGYPKGTLAKYNPDLLHRMTPWTGSHAVTVPAKDRRAFTLALRKTRKLIYGGGTHRVARGETVSGIAARYRVSARDLMRLNNISSPRKLRAGQSLKIPGNGRGGRSESSSAGGTYTVKRGDTLYDIARANHVTVAQLQAWNGLGRKSLQIGQKLHLSDPEKGHSVETVPSGAVAPGGVWHTVRKGDSAWKIAKRYKVPLDDVLAWNNLTKRSKLSVGQKIQVKRAAPGPAPTAGPPAEREKIFHTVVKGDTASTIAARYGVKTSDFLAWNGLTSRSVLPVGKRYVVHQAKAQTEASSSPRESQAEFAGKRIEHTVSRGQNPTTIARRYGVRVSDLFKWNHWPRNHVLHIGDKVVLYRR